MYKETFQIAYERTLKLGLKVPKVYYSDKWILNSGAIQKVQQAVDSKLGKAEPHHLHANCMAIHYNLKSQIEKAIQSEAYYTIGYVEVGSHAYFKITEDKIADLLKNKITKPLNAHAWLTLPTMEVIDLTFITTYLIATNSLDGNGIGGVIAKHPSKLGGGMRYIPMLVGDDFLRKANGLFE